MKPENTDNNGNQPIQGKKPFCRLLRSIYLFFPLALLLKLGTPSYCFSASYDVNYLNKILDDAQRLNLSEHHYWDVLIHYHPDGNNRKSEIDDPLFFLSTVGKNDPEAELKATISGFFEEPDESKEPVRCRYIARYAWLKEQLKIDESRLPFVVCTAFEQNKSGFTPRSVALIFPVAYISSPASMFGHTLLRIDGSNESPLVSSSVNYAAFTDGNSGFNYAFKGIFGGYNGYYNSRPYYEKVREYTAIEHRDIWEYNLDLTDVESMRIVMHLWELREIKSPYYFFDNNCSYAVLYLLDIARPSLRLIETYGHKHKFWVIPSETVNAVVGSGIVRNVVYRPSQGTRIRNTSYKLSLDERQLVYNVVTGKEKIKVFSESAMSEDNQTIALKLTSEYLQYLASHRLIESEEYLNIYHEVINELGRRKQPSEQLSDRQLVVQPDKGHFPGRIGIGVGCQSGSCFEEIALKPAYHDLLDNDTGYVEGSQINFMSANLRYDNKLRHLTLNSLQLIDIKSLAISDLFFQPIAWKLNVGVQQKVISGGKEKLVPAISVGGGISKLLGPARAYALAEMELNATRLFDGGTALGAGGAVGLFVPLTPWWKLHGSVRGIAPLFGDRYWSLRGEVEQSISISQNSSVLTSISRQNMNEYFRSEMKLLFNFYF